MDVRSEEVLALKEERLTGGLSEGVGEAVPEVETSGMATFPVVGVALSCEESLLGGDWLDLNSGLAKKSLILTNNGVATARFKYDRSFHETSG